MRRPGESKQHDQQKERIGQAAKEKGWNIQIDTKEFNIPGREYPYIADVYAENYSRVEYRRLRVGDIPRSSVERGLSTSNGKESGSIQSGMRRFIAELEGYKGHNTKLAHQLDSIRIAQIREFHGSEIEYKEFFLRNKSSPNDIRNYSKEDIQEHLKL